MANDLKLTSPVGSTYLLTWRAPTNYQVTNTFSIVKEAEDGTTSVSTKDVAGPTPTTSLGSETIKITVTRNGDPWGFRENMPDPKVTTKTGANNERYLEFTFTFLAKDPAVYVFTVTYPPVATDKSFTQTVTVTQRLRLSVVDFNAGFSTIQAGVVGVDTTLLDLFKTARIDDYTLINCIFFNGENLTTHDPNPPHWAPKGFGPRGQFTDKARFSYLKALIAEMHSRGTQVIVGYTLDEGAPVTNPADPKGPKIAHITKEGTAFKAWLGAATTPQVTAHAQQIADFFFNAVNPDTNQTDPLLIDGVDFDFEINGLGSNANHAANIKTLYTELAKAMDTARPGASVSYDNTTFLGSDGNSTIGHFKVQPYSIAANTTNIIARPMHNLDAAADKTTIQNTIALALQASGGGLAPGNLQIMLDFRNTTSTTVVDICKTVLLPNRVGLVLYNLGMSSFSQSSLQSFVTQAQSFEQALNPAAGAPGKKTMPVQAPLGANLP